MRLADTATLVSIATAPVARILRKVAAMSRDMVTVARFARTMGAGEDWTNGRLSAVGRIVAATYRKVHHAEPRKAWELSERGIHRHMAYLDNRENAEMLTSAIRAYAKKNHLSLNDYVEAA